MHKPEGVRFLARPLFAIPEGTPCLRCAHSFTSSGKQRHEYLYTIGNRDYYRCKAKGCACGVQYEVRGIALPDDATEADAERAMGRLAAGAGDVVNPGDFGL